MEGLDIEHDISGRVRRPGSSTSSQSKITSQSSNSSSTKLNYRNQISRREGQVQDQIHHNHTPTGSFLQERLREKKAYLMNERRNSGDIDALYEDRVVRSSPVRQESLTGQSRDRDVRRPSSSGKAGGERANGRKSLGVKEMEEVKALS